MPSRCGGHQILPVPTSAQRATEPVMSGGSGYIAGLLRRSLRQSRQNADRCVFALAASVIQQLTQIVMRITGFAGNILRISVGHPGNYWLGFNKYRMVVSVDVQ